MAAGRAASHPSVRDLRRSFKTEAGWREVVKGVSFDIGPRETVALVGESGLRQERHRAVLHAADAGRIEPRQRQRAAGGRDVLGLSEPRCAGSAATTWR